MRTRCSSDKERQAGTVERCRTMSREVVSWRVERKGLAEEKRGPGALQGRRICRPGERPRSQKTIGHRERNALRFSCESYDFGKEKTTLLPTCAQRDEVCRDRPPHTCRYRF